MIMVVCTVILAFGRLRKEDYCKLETSLGYMVTFCLNSPDDIYLIKKTHWNLLAASVFLSAGVPYDI